MSESSAYVERYLRRRDEGAVKEILTPEGVPLHFTVAPLSSRFGALALDLLFMICGFFLAAAPGVVMLIVGVGSGFAMAWIGLAFFFLTNFYFIFFEIRRQGSTPGKRIAGIKVIDRHGGVLTAEAIFARNLTRQVELFIPLILILSLWVLAAGSSGALPLLGGVWVFIVALLPAFNREHLRAGDMIAGTIVVLAPRAVLFKDLVQEVKAADHFEFTPEQLGVYGVYELQVLEDLLRQDAGGDRAALELVCMKIREKIGWDLTTWVDPWKFLNDFYAAQRARLERGMLLGKRKETK